jgi:molybdenum ABC transporter, periplasmic molybdate-binding protein
MKTLLTALFLALTCLLPAQAKELNVVVATNFQGTLQILAAEFEKNTGHKIVISGVSAGPAYAQIVNGAPFDVWFSADVKNPETLDVKDGLALPGSRFTYAIGVLVLWSAKPDLVDGQGEVLKQDNWRHIAVSNPETAPYGTAGHQVMAKLGVLDKLKAAERIVQPNSVGQAYSQTASGAADLGFVALAQVIQKDGSIPGSHWFPPADYYNPIVQQALIVKSTKEPELAKEFIAWIRSSKATEIIKAAGYTVPNT